MFLGKYETFVDKSDVGQLNIFIASQFKGNNADEIDSMVGYYSSRYTAENFMPDADNVYQGPEPRLNYLLGNTTLVVGKTDWVVFCFAKGLKVYSDDQFKVTFRKRKTGEWKKWVATFALTALVIACITPAVSRLAKNGEVSAQNSQAANVVRSMDKCLTEESPNATNPTAQLLMYKTCWNHSKLTNKSY